MAAVAQIAVESIAAGGDGVGRVDGLAVFVPRTAPGDVAEVRIATRGRFGRGTVVRVVEPSPQRATPRCQHYEGDHCGGCQVQHLAYDAQLEAKRRIVRDALRRIAGRECDPPPVVASPQPWAYRAKLTLTLRRAGGSWIAGLHAYDDPGRVFDLRECPITDPAVVEAWREIRRAADALPHADELRGAVRRQGDELAFVLEGAVRWDRWRDFAGRCPALHFIRWTSASGEARVLLDRRSSASPAASFEQVNPAVAALLRAALLERARASLPATAIDAYAGSGATARALAAEGIRVTAVEVDREAAAFAAERLPAGSSVRTSRVEDVIARLLPADLVVLNPPRAGVDAKVTEALDAARPRSRILYVSCDPATLARDIKRLPHHAITWIQSFDMFPQTAHVETVCELSPEGP